MTEEILTIREGYVNDDSVEQYKYIWQDSNRSEGNLNTEGEITITFQNQDAWLFPSDSYLRIEGVLKTADGADVANNAAIAFANNGLMFLFSNVRYFLGGEEIEYFENAGVTTTIYNYLTQSGNYRGGNWFGIPDKGTAAANANNTAWRDRNLLTNPQADGGVWNFGATLPLSAIFSFCNDYRKVIYGMSHKIALTKTNSKNALFRTNAAVAASGIYPALVPIADDVLINITTLKWVMKFHKMYNNDRESDPSSSFWNFLKIAPLYVFDVSNQPEKVKNTSTDVVLDITFATAVPANTIAHVVTYFDSMYTLTGDNNKQIIRLFNYQ